MKIRIDGSEEQIILTNDENSIFNRLAVEEKYFEGREATIYNRVCFYDEKDIDFSEFCSEIVGDG